MFQNVIKLACGWSRIRKVFTRLHKYIIRIAENQGQFLKLIQNVIKMTCDWNRIRKSG